MSYIGNQKWSYFHPPDGFRYCSGAKVACQDLETEGYKIVPWDADVRDLPIKNIKLLHLEPTKQQLKKAALPTFMGELSQLEHAVFEINFLRTLEAGGLPSSLRSLILSRNLSYPELCEALISNPVSWPNPSFKKLEALFFVADEEKDKLLEELSPTRFPKLKFLGFSLTKKAHLSVLERFNKLTDLELTGLQDYPVFDHIHHLPLVSLDLAGSSKKFSLDGLGAIKTLKFVRLNGIRAEVDCRLFTNFPRLEEVVILNSKNVSHVEALLDCPKLKSVDFLDCKNPFKGVAEKFYKRGFEHLSIEYA